MRRLLLLFVAACNDTTLTPAPTQQATFAYFKPQDGDIQCRSAHEEYEADINADGFDDKVCHYDCAFWYPMGPFNAMNCEQPAHFHIVGYRDAEGVASVGAFCDYQCVEGLP